MRKAVLLGLILVLLLGLLSGCGGNGEIIADNGEENGEEVPFASGNITITPELERMVNHFRDAGLQIGEYTEKSYEMIGASAGFGLEVEGGDIELYYYDPNQTDAEVLNNLENKHNPDATFAIVINGNYELALALHPEQEKVIEVFESF